MLELYFKQIEERALPDGGFTNHPNGVYRPDATAWAILLLQANRSKLPILNVARDRLIENQYSDGRVTISPHHSDAYWPTPLAIFAWHDSPNHQRVKKQAIQFLLETSGLHWENHDRDIVGHDSSIPGWPWISETHSWVSPTAFAILALSVVGLDSHHRVAQGVRMILDRQLPSGGWNYGNTTVLGKELRPFPETTGMALNALAGHVPREAIEPSLEYLLALVSTLRTPLSLGWSILGLKAWNVAPDNTHEWIIEALQRGHLYGGYDTASLCLLLAANLARGGLETLTKQVPQEMNRQ